MDRIVDATTSFVANISSQPYFDARMLVVAPAGIAVRMTHTPVTRDGTPSSVHMGLYRLLSFLYRSKSANKPRLIEIYRHIRRCAHGADTFGRSGG